VNIIDLFEDASKFIIHTENEVARTAGKMWKDSTFAVSFVNPLIDRSLRIRSAVNFEDFGTFIIEACRLALIPSLAPLRREFSRYPVTTSLHVRKLHMLLADCSSDWEELKELQLCVVAMGILEAEKPTQKDRFECDLIRISWGYGFTKLQEAEGVLEGLVWAVSVHGPKLRSLKVYSKL
jgi:hypothetical protein